MMSTVNIYKVKANLAHLVAKVEKAGAVVIDCNDAERLW